jgi:hypothetical protein
MKLERILAIHSSYSLSIDRSEGASYPDNAVDEILQNGLEELVRNHVGEGDLGRSSNGAGVGILHGRH